MQKIGALQPKMESDQRMVSQFVIQYGALIAFVLLFLFNVVYTPNFFSIDTVFLIMKQSTSLLFVTIGMTMVISAGGTDISAGSTMAFSGIIVTLLLLSGVPLLLCIFASVVICSLVGLFNGFIIAKIGVQPIILTLVMQIVLRGITVMLANSTIISLASYHEVAFIGIKRFWGIIPIQIIYFAIAVLLGWVLIKKTIFGKFVESIGECRQAARLVSVNTVLVTVAVYMLSAVLASIAGVLELSRSGALDPNLLGKLFELDAIAAVAIGGTSMKGGKVRLMGSILGCLLIIMIGTTVNMNGIAYSYANLIKAAIIIFSLAIQKTKSN